MALNFAALPDDVDALRALVAAQGAELAAKNAELAAQHLLLDRLRIQLVRLRRMQFGRSSERLRACANRIAISPRSSSLSWRWRILRPRRRVPGAGDGAPAGDGHETAKLNGTDPAAYLRHVLSTIADYPVSRVAELLPRAATGLLIRLDQT